jgi:hypothetical protein
MTERIEHLKRLAAGIGLAGLLVLAGLGAGAAPALAAGPTPPTIGTRVTVTNPSEVVIGTSVAVEAKLTTLGGNAIEGARLVMNINGTQARASRTNAAGVVSFSVPSDRLSTEGSLAIVVLFSGDNTHIASSAKSSMTVRGAQIRIVTVPAVTGLSISLGDTVAVTDAEGAVTFSVPTLGRQSISPSFDLPDSAGIRVSFVRWQDDVFEPRRAIDIAGDTDLVLGVRVAVRTHLVFIDPSSRPIDPSLVQSVSMETGSGPGRTVTAYDTVWLDAQIPVKRTFGLVAVPNVHRISEVLIAGTNVVNRGQQTWEPTLDGTWTVEVLLYELDVRVTDALLGSPLTTTVSLEYPDGSSVTLPTVDGQVAFGSLPRGDYRILVHAGGIVPPSPIALSRPQDTTIRIISNLDLSIGGGLLFGTIALLLVLGRRHQLVALAQSAVRAIDTAGRRVAHLTGGADRIVRAIVMPIDARIQARSAGRRGLPDDRSAAAARASSRGFGATVERLDASIHSFAEDRRRRILATILGLAIMAIVVVGVAITVARPADAAPSAPSPAAISIDHRLAGAGRTDRPLHASHDPLA